jgi:hypothetical protein
MNGFTITAAGMALLAKLLAGEQLVITRVMVGSGVLAAGQDPALLTDLVEPVTAASTTLPAVANLVASFMVEYRNDMNGGLENGFWIDEFGLFADDPDDGEILLYYATLGEFPEHVPPYNGDICIRRYPVEIALVNDVSVTIAYPAGTVVTQNDMRTILSDFFAVLRHLPIDCGGFIQDDTPVPSFPIFIKDEISEGMLTEHNADPNAHQNIIIDGNAGGGE